MDQPLPPHFCPLRRMADVSSDGLYQAARGKRVSLYNIFPSSPSTGWACNPTAGAVSPSPLSLFVVPKQNERGSWSHLQAQKGKGWQCRSWGFHQRGFPSVLTVLLEPCWCLLLCCPVGLGPAQESQSDLSSIPGCSAWRSPGCCFFASLPYRISRSGAADGAGWGSVQELKEFGKQMWWEWAVTLPHSCHLLVCFGPRDMQVWAWLACPRISEMPISSRRQLKEVSRLAFLPRACFLLPVLRGDHRNKLCSEVMERNVEAGWCARHEFVWALCLLVKSLFPKLALQ